MSHSVLKKIRKTIRREVKEGFPKYLVQHVYVLPLSARLKIAWMIIRRG